MPSLEAGWASRYRMSHESLENPRLWRPLEFDVLRVQFR